MRAVFFDQHGDLDVLQYGEFADIATQPGWVKVRVHACSLNYLDIFSRRGIVGVRTQLPGITGSDVAGEIAEVGEGVTRWSVGQRVLVYPVHWTPERLEIMGETRPGGLAEYCTAREDQLMPLPEHLPYELAACAGCAYGTAYRMLFTRGALRAGEKVLVLGASGGVGNAALLLSKMVGAYVIAAAGSDDKCARLREMGADETINYEKIDFEEYIRKTTGSLLRGGGCDVVVNFTGGDTWAKSIRCVKRHGRLLTCGGTAGYFPSTDIRFIMMAEMDIRGSTGWKFEEQEAVLTLIAENRIKPVIGGVFALSEGIDACRALQDRNFFGKIVVKPDRSEA